MSKHPTRGWRYEYRLLGESVPIRITFDEQGLLRGAEVPDREKGCLVYNHMYLSRLELSDEVETLTEQQWEERCRTFYSKRR